MKEKDSKPEQKNQNNLITRWGVFGFVFATAVLMTLYVYNVIEVNDLMLQNRRLEAKSKSLNQSNELLQTKVIELQSADRICTIAKERLGMVSPEKAPRVIIQKPGK
ncbi:MAG: hypothetical protein QG635_317 [Bacteroidota bacterium]|nr:hypothetical protein [Bacteroidota bacterium]